MLAALMAMDVLVVVSREKRTNDCEDRSRRALSLLLQLDLGR